MDSQLDRGGEPQGLKGDGPATTFEEFAAARERFFAHLRADSEIRRLEALWRLPAATVPRPGADTPGAHD
jgi:hypothetical protein